MSKPEIINIVIMSGRDNITGDYNRHEYIMIVVGQIYNRL